MSLCCWSRIWGAKKEELANFSKISFEGLPACAWEAKLVAQLVTELKGKLVSIKL